MRKNHLVFTAVMLLCITFTQAWAFRLPPESPDDLYKAQIRQLSDTVSAQRWAILILCIIVILSLVVSIFLFLSLWKSQRQTIATLESVRNINLMKETAVQLASSARRREEQVVKDIAEEDLDDVEIKIVRSGL